MKIKPAIRSEEEIDTIIFAITGTWVKRRNARIKITNWSNDLVNKEIQDLKYTIRKLKAEGLRDGELRTHFAKITKLELKLI